jgi:alpha-tubulin suppressor-like RCC1 family protein
MFISLCTGQLFALGRNTNGQLGLGDKVTRHTFTEVVQFEDASQLPTNTVKVSTGKSHSIILTSNGNIYGAGANNFGQLGLGDGIKNSQDCTIFKRLSLTYVRDIACGAEFTLVCNTDGALYSFGHPEYGQLGHGSDGKYIKEGARGMQHNFITRPRQVRKFISIDNQSKKVTELSSDDVKVRSVAAGRNHSVCIEDWDDCSKGSGRVFSWGFGGYGRLGM